MLTDPTENADRLPTADQTLSNALYTTEPSFEMTTVATHTDIYTGKL